MDKVRYGIIGVGNQGSTYVRNFFDKGEIKDGCLTAICDNNPEKIENIREKIKNFVYNPYRKIIDMIPVFVDKKVPQLLMNGYRFENLNVSEESFEDDNINNIFEKCNRIIISDKITIITNYIYNTSIIYIKYNRIYRKNQIFSIHFLLFFIPFPIIQILFQ